MEPMKPPLLGPVSGFVLGIPYIAGDAVCWADVKTAIAKRRPGVAVVDGSGTRCLDSDPLVMTTNDVQHVAARVPTVVVHLEAINHCLGTRTIPRADRSLFPVERVRPPRRRDPYALYPQGTTTPGTPVSLVAPDREDQADRDRAG